MILNHYTVTQYKKIKLLVYTSIKMVKLTNEYVAFGALMIITVSLTDLFFHEV